MWYFAWILGTLLACAFGVITALALELLDGIKESEENTDKDHRDSLYVNE